jgi:UDP-N-acetylmuramoyl-tripeptide--D-alanyl-D-alanine ligase
MAVVEVPERRVTILDDCYNANPASMRQALLTAHQVRMPGERLLLVLGDMLELGNLSALRHQEMGELIATLRPRPDLVVTVGPEANLIATETERAGIETHRFAKSEAAATCLQETVLGHQAAQLVLVKGSRGIRLEEVTRSFAEVQRSTPESTRGKEEGETKS